MFVNERDLVKQLQVHKESINTHFSIKKSLNDTFINFKVLRIFYLESN